MKPNRWECTSSRQLWGLNAPQDGHKKVKKEIRENNGSSSSPTLSLLHILPQRFKEAQYLWTSSKQFKTCQIT